MASKKTIPEGKVACKECHGTGEVHSHNPKCWECNGSGYVDPPKLEVEVESLALLPCAHCKGKPKSEYAYGQNGRSNKMVWWVHCTECGISTKEHENHLIVESEWNTRPDMPKTKEELMAHINMLVTHPFFKEDWIGDEWGDRADVYFRGQASGVDGACMRVEEALMTGEKNGTLGHKRLRDLCTMIEDLLKSHCTALVRYYAESRRHLDPRNREPGWYYEDDNSGECKAGPFKTASDAEKDADAKGIKIEF